MNANLQRVLAFVLAAAAALASGIGAAERAPSPPDRSVEVRALDRALAGAAERLARGQVSAALRAFEDAARLAAHAGDALAGARAANGLAAALVAAGRPEEAVLPARRALELARESNDARAIAQATVTQGSLEALAGRPAVAIDLFETAAATSRAAGDRAIAARALANGARAAVAAGRPGEAESLLARARAEADRLDPAPDRVTVLIAVGTTSGELAAAAPSLATLFDRAAIDALREADALARTLRADALSSHAAGEIGAIEARRGAREAALAETLAAALAAQRAQATHLAFRWEWQAARLLRDLGREDAALAAFRRAVDALRATRDDLACEYGARGAALRQATAPLFAETIDLVLREASRPADEPARQALLREARGLAESAKADELRDYFRDECVTALGGRTVSLDDLTPRTAVVYPIVLADRLELLAAVGGRLYQRTVAVSADELAAEAGAFRRALQRFRGTEHATLGARLHARLVAPLEPLLVAHAIDTLVFVPDRFLRGIPLAALSDARGYVVERFAIVTTPGLEVTDARRLDAARSRLLAGGLTRAVQGFAPLPAVAGELAALGRDHGATLLVDEHFTAAAFAATLAADAYRIVHVATHGKIEADARRSFLLTYDGRLSMDDVDRMIGGKKLSRAPVELLTLSACDTALGDERAALGLAGLAVKAGARSVVATLWPISDEATALLMPEFFGGILRDGLSRAGALQRAQRKLLAEPRFAHPGYWAPFLLIGGWL
jgi:CHAT domain-containing protein